MGNGWSKTDCFDHKEVSFRFKDENDSALIESEKELEMDNISEKRVMDAIESKKNMEFNSRRLLLNDLPVIEKLLDYDEKVSIVFLLYDNIEFALQTLSLLKQGSNIEVITEWVKSVQTNSDWNNELLEALSIVQNYSVLKKLGYQKDDLMSRFLPRRDYSYVFVNHVKKLLYLLCESLSSEMTKEFILCLKSRYKSSTICFDNNNIEITLVSLASKKCFSFNNLNPIVQILKELNINLFIDQMQKYCKPHIYKPELNAFLPNNSAIQQSENVVSSFNLCEIKNRYCVDQNNGIPEPCESDISRRSSVSNPLEHNVRQKKYSSPDISFKINETNPGICLIINQENFYTECDDDLKGFLPKHGRKLDDRLGTEKDCKLLKDTFTGFGFTVHIENNKTHQEMISVTEKVVMSITNDTSIFVLCIMSHGANGKVYGVNSIPVEITVFKNIICKRNLRNLKQKPKILILQACQGTKCQEVVNVNEHDENEDYFEMDGPDEAIAYADMLTFSATVPGFGAVRSPTNGTWFIQAFCQKLEENWNRHHFEEICTLVKRDVINKRWGRKVMVPELKSTFSKFLYFPQYMQV